MRASRLGDVGGEGGAEVTAELGDGSTCWVGIVIPPVHVDQVLELRTPLRGRPHVGDRPLDAADISLLYQKVLLAAPAASSMRTTAARYCRATTDARACH